MARPGVARDVQEGEGFSAIIVRLPSLSPPHPHSGLNYKTQLEVRQTWEDLQIMAA